MSNPWSTPDPRRTATFSSAYASGAVLPDPDEPTVAADVTAGVLAAVVTVLVGAPVGLLWGALAPRVDVLIVGQNVQFVQPGSNAFIAADGFYLLAVLVAGAFGGLFAWWLGRAHGPAVVVGLAVGGIAAAYVAMVVGQQVGLADVERAVAAGQQGALELTVRLRAKEALVGWPVGALAAYVGASVVRGR